MLISLGTIIVYSRFDIMKTKLLLFISLLSASFTHAQTVLVSPKDSIRILNDKRIKINTTGMEVLGAWGIANIAEGGIGYFSAKQDTWKAFHEMNAIWGVINTGIAVAGFSGARRELEKKYNTNQSYDRYKATKKLFLINAGLDVVYIGIGAGLYEYSQSKSNKNPTVYDGFGKSFVLQGVFLLLFDNTMFALHNRSNSRWLQAMQEIQFTGKGIGFVHTFK